jgi:Zn-dependent protease
MLSKNLKSSVFRHHSLLLPSINGIRLYNYSNNNDPRFFARNIAKYGPYVTAPLILVWKWKPVSIFLTKLPVIGKAFPLLISLPVSLYAYTMFYGFNFAASLVSLLFIHELGHALAMKRFGIPVSSITFIPFLGAVTSMTNASFVGEREKSLIALSGPLLGSLACLPILAYGVTHGSLFALAVSNYSLFLNALNLLPVGSLDGGLVAESLDKRAVYLGAGVSIGLLSAFPHNPLIWLLAGTSSWRAFQKYREPANMWWRDDQSGLDRNERFEITWKYLTLLAGVGTLTGVSERLLKKEEFRRDW